MHGGPLLQVITKPVVYGPLTRVAQRAFLGGSLQSPQSTGDVPGERV